MAQVVDHGRERARVGFLLSNCWCRSAGILVLAWAAMALPAHGAEILVNTAVDLVDTAGDCSLREAIDAANADVAVDGCAAGSGADTIRFAPALDGVTILLTDSVRGSLDIAAGTDLSIVGNGREKTVIAACEDPRWYDANPRGTAVPVSCKDLFNPDTGGPYLGIKDRVFYKVGAPPASLTLAHLTVANGYASGLGGGGVYSSSGSLVVTDVWFRGNVSGDPSGQGGAIYSALGSATELTVSDCQFGGGRGSNADAERSGNFSRSLGGAIFAGGTVTIARSTFFGNTAKAGSAVALQGGTLQPHMVTDSAFVYNWVTGGAVGGIRSEGTLLVAGNNVVANSTFAENDATEGFSPGIRITSGDLTLTHVTMTGNRSSAGIPRSLVVSNSSGTGVPTTVTVVNSILTGSDGNADCGFQGDDEPTVVSGGHNHVRDPGACSFAATGDVTGADPELGEGGRFFGPSETSSLAATSPAIDSADAAACAAAPVSNRDQRGFARPAGPACDRGAFEAGTPYCPIGKMEVTSLSEDFESDPGWPSDGTGPGWSASTAQAHGGTTSWNAPLPSGSATDSRLRMPTLALPVDRAPLALRFWSYRDFGPIGGWGAYDTGARLEVSTDGGATWEGLEGENERFIGFAALNNSALNTADRGGLGLWGSTPWRSTEVRLDEFAGQTVEIRFRAANAPFNSHSGWFLDDVTMVGCCWEATCTAIFANGFE